MESIAFAGEALGVTEVANRIGLAKSAVHKHLQGLTERGYLLQDPATARYTLGPKSYLIGRLAPAIDDVAGAAEGPMIEARDKLGLSAVLTAPSVNGALVLKTVDGMTSIAIGARMGSELSFHASAQGQVMLAFGAAQYIQRTLRQPLLAFTPHSITDPARLLAAVERVREQGYAVAPEQALLGINAVAAPVFNADEGLVGAVAIVGSIQYVPAEPDDAMIATVKSMAQRISRSLGFGLMEQRRAG